MNRPTSIVCARCGASKRVAPKGTIPRFCGHGCSQAAHRERLRAATTARLAQWECVLCGTSRKVAHGCRRYCSQACVHRAHKIRSYGLTATEWIDMARSQNWACAICRSGGTRGEALAILCVDHDHSTGAVRGLLCRTCNTGIGHLRDDAGLLRRAVTYLEAAA